MCALCAKKTIKIISEPKKEGHVIFYNVLPMQTFLLKNCFDILIKFNVSHH
jgi:CRISPR/Cas system CMR subunit Cmr6 (Cas7 group RAMP superfamily)